MFFNCTVVGPISSVTRTVIPLIESPQTIYGNHPSSPKLRVSPLQICGILQPGLTATFKLILSPRAFPALVALPTSVSYMATFASSLHNGILNYNTTMEETPHDLEVSGILGSRRDVVYRSSSNAFSTYDIPSQDVIPTSLHYTLPHTSLVVTTLMSPATHHYIASVGASGDRVRMRQGRDEIIPFKDPVGPVPASR